ncbi:MAG: hypothetical protein QXX38_02370 [Candidatus Aenigmatarchaeota archaeon]
MDYNKGIKIKITKNRVLFLLALILIFFILYFYLIHSRPIYEVYFDGTLLVFRENLKEASKIKTHPSENLIYSTIWNSEVKNITIAFINTSDISYVGIQAFEIAFKLRIFMLKNNLSIGINSKEIEDFNIITTKENPYIILVPPSISKDTAVMAEKNLIFIKAKNYKDFDLATIKFLMIALNIKI